MTPQSSTEPAAEDSVSAKPTEAPRIAVIGCAVLEDEVRHFLEAIEVVSSVHFLKQGLHDEPDRLRRELQEAIDEVESKETADVIALVYGFCSRGIEGVSTKRSQLVVARAHDCITLLLGSKEAYAEYASKHPGTYWYSPGWNKSTTMPGPERHDKLKKKYEEKFDPDDVDYLLEMEEMWMKEYSRATYVDLGISNGKADEDYTKSCADWLGWGFDSKKGDPTLLKDLLSGRWDDERFLLVGPGQTFKASADERVIKAAVCASCPLDKDSQNNQKRI
jgi:hypothetical protein